ncbi:Fc.00g054860.m01.CDS01 [Cosmosporella sp. VM-42]
MAYRTPRIKSNFERGQRYTGLTRQAQLYYEQHKNYAESCEVSAKRLFEAVGAIAAAQGKTWDQVLGLSGDFSNMVFDGGFEYHGPESVGESLSFTQWFFLSSLVGLGNAYAGASSLFNYVGCTLGLTADGYPIAPRMHIGALLRLARAPESCPLRKGLPWARLGLFFRPNGGSCPVPLIGLELFTEELAYNDSTETIHDLAPMRLDACAHSIMMKTLSDSISVLATKAAKHAENPQTALSFKIPKEFDNATQSLIAAIDKVPDEALERVKDYDRIYQKGYMGDDPDLTNHVFDLRKAAPSSIFRLDVSSDFAVNMLTAETGCYDGSQFGKSNGTMVQTFLEDGELITGATWNTGTLARDQRKKVIFDLTITTIKRTLGPFGTGGDKTKPDAMKQVFQVPDKMKVCGLIDLSSKFIVHQGDVVMDDGPYIVQLRFLVAPAN